ncbi:MAG: prolyl oligopeptidase family serine peptidase [Verrucomicrobiales bacterium]|nr:prolyl oligopeptidase family serine peptidase [Verrucomicrobiales bacterium]
MKSNLLWVFSLVFLSSIAMSKDYPEGVKEVKYLSAADNSEQPALFWKPENQSEPAPLLVALHTWSGDFRQTGSQIPMADWCQQMGWTFIHPNFRGKNWYPDALGSDLAVGDIISAVDFAKETAMVDEKRIYCIGVSGGGHASLLMAARAPEIWAGVSAWCGISDVAKWHQQCVDTRFSRYAEHIEKALGGNPANFTEDAMRRSPVYWLEKNRDKLPPLDIWHGIKDGRIGSVPFKQSLEAWNAAVPADQQFPDAAIEKFYETQAFPEADLPDFGNRKVWFQKKSGNIRLSIFEGGHEILQEPALNWLAVQAKGAAPKWDAAPVAKLKVSPEDTESGK